LNPQGFFYALKHEQQLGELCQRADVIHCHDDTYPTKIPHWNGKKRLVYQAHIGDIPRRLFRPRRFTYNRAVRHACITNGYGRHFDREQQQSGVAWGRLPDILDLDHPVYRPNPELRRANPNFTVVFTYSNRHEPGGKINAKGPLAHRELLKPVAAEGVDVRIITGVKFEQSMAEKQRAHIVLDEVFSPYTHLSALEGAAAGACVLTSYDDYTIRDLCDSVGAPRSSYPFVRVTKQDVAKKILELRGRPDEVAEIGRAARAWMEQYYDHRKLLRMYLDFYHS
jgi:hypothetical protein